MQPTLSVVASLPPGHTATLVPGERLTLTATLQRADGVADCTASAIWTSTDEAVAHFTATPGELIGTYGGKVIVSATCDGSRSAPLMLTVTAGARITGHEREPFILPGVKDENVWFSGQLVPLSAYHVDATGARGSECVNVKWSTSDPSVATTTSFPLSDYIGDGGYLIGHSPGTATINVSCDGVIGQTSIQVRRFKIQGVVRDQSGQPVSGVTVYVRYSLDRPTSSDLTLMTAADGSYEGEWGTTSMWLQAIGPPNSTAPRTAQWNHTASMTVDLSVPRRPIVLLEGSGTICLSGASDPACTNASRDIFGVGVRAQVNGPAVVKFSWPGYPGGGYANGKGLRVFVLISQPDYPPTIAETLDASGSGALTWNASAMSNYSVYFNNLALPVLPFTFRIEQ